MTLLTAEQIEDDFAIQALGERIAAHLAKARAYEAKAHAKAGVELRKADDHWNTVTRLLAEARARCDDQGFDAFKTEFCPDLSRSRVYELLAIGNGTKTIEETRDATRERVRKYRAGEKAAAASVTVTDEPRGNFRRA